MGGVGWGVRDRPRATTLPSSRNSTIPSGKPGKSRRLRASALRSVEALAKNPHEDSYREDFSFPPDWQTSQQGSGNRKGDALRGSSALSIGAHFYLSAPLPRADNAERPFIIKGRAIRKGIPESQVVRRVRLSKGPREKKKTALPPQGTTQEKGGVLLAYDGEDQSSSLAKRAREVRKIKRNKTNEGPGPACRRARLALSVGIYQRKGSRRGSKTVSARLISSAPLPQKVHRRLADGVISEI